MNEHELDAALEAAPRKAPLPRDPWPAIERGIEEQRRRRSRVVWAAAAAVVLFAAGVGVGFAAGQGWPSSGSPPVASFSPSPAFLAAARVQGAGSDYLAAVAALQRIGRERPNQDPVAVGQGYEATVAVLQTLAETVEAGPVGGRQARPLAVEAARVRAVVDTQVTRLIDTRGTGGAR